MMTSKALSECLLQCFANNFETLTEKNPEIVDSKASCIGTLDKMLGEAEVLALLDARDLASIKARFMRRIDEKKALSPNVATAAKDAITETIDVDCAALANFQPEEGLVYEKKEKQEMDHFTIEMFKEGVQRFCGSMGLSVEEANFKNLFLITARNAIYQNLKLLDFVMEPMQRQKQLELLQRDVAAQRVKVAEAQERGWGMEWEYRRLTALERQEITLGAKCTGLQEQTLLYGRFIAEFSKLSAVQILTTENALTAFAEHNNEALVPNTLRAGLAECGIFQTSSYIKTPQFLLDADANSLRTFLEEKTKENVADRKKMLDFVQGVQNTYQADRAVCSSLMRLFPRYLPKAAKALNKAGAKLDYEKKQDELNPYILEWEKEQEKVKGFDKITEEIALRVEATIAKLNQDHNVAINWLCAQSVRANSLRAIVRDAYSNPSDFDAIVQSEETGGKAWADYLLGRNGRCGLNPRQKAAFTAQVVADLKMAFSRLQKGSGAYKNLVDDTDCRPAKARGGLNNLTLSTLAIIWMAIHDRSKVLAPLVKDRPDELLEDTDQKITGSDGKETTKRAEITRVIQLKEEALMQGFWEFQTEYGGDSACAHGTYNKLVESLNLLDPDVRVGNSVDADFTTVLKEINSSFIPKLVESAARHSSFNLEKLSEAWDSSTPSREERTLIKKFRDHVKAEIKLKILDYLKKEFTEYVSTLEKDRSTENVIALQIIPSIMAQLHYNSLVSVPVKLWVRERIPELTYEAALVQFPPLTGTAEEKHKKALRRVAANGIAYSMEKILIAAGVSVCTNSEQDNQHDIVALLAPQLAKVLTEPLMPGQQLHVKQCIRQALADFAPEGSLNNIPQGVEALITNLSDEFIRIEQRAKQQHPLVLRDVRSFLGDADAQRRENVGIAAPYATMFHLPALPSVFPFNPNGEERINLGIPSFSVAATVQQPQEDQLPDGVLEQLRANGISLNNLQMFFCVQNTPWNDSTLLLRPHPWLHPEAQGNQVGYNRSSNIQAGVTGIGAGFSELVTIDDVQTRTASTECLRANPNINPGDVVYLAGQMPVVGTEDLSRTHCFYSLCVDRTTNRAALTLHWLLNDADHAQIRELLSDTPTLEAFSERVMRLGQAVTLNRPINGVTPVKALNTMLRGSLFPRRPSVGQYRLFEQQPENQVVPMAAAGPVFHFPGGEVDEKLPREVAESRLRGPAMPVMHIGGGVQQPQPHERPGLLQATEAQRRQEEAARQEGLRQDVARQAELARQQAAEAARQAEARRVEAERQAAVARAAAPAPAANLNTVRRR